MKIKRTLPKKRILLTTTAIALMAATGVSYAVMQDSNKPTEPIVTAVTEPSTSPSPSTAATVAENPAPSPVPTPSANTAPTPSVQPTKAFSIDNLTIDQIEQNTMASQCASIFTKPSAVKGTDPNGKLYEYEIDSRSEWETFAKKMIQEKRTKLYANKDGHRFCVYWNTQQELETAYGN